MARIIPIKPTDKRSVLVFLAIAGAVAVAACGQNVSQISPTAAKSGGVAASISPGAVTGSRAGATTGQAAPSGSRTATTPSQAAKGASTACPTQGVGGDNLPPLCAPSSSSPSPAFVQGPATVGTPPPSLPQPPSCLDLAVESVSPGKGAEVGGDIVTIKGTGFSAGIQVFFGGTPAKALTVESGTKITATTPRGPSRGGRVDITLGCYGLPLETAFSFTYESAVPTATVTPTVTLMPSPASPTPSPLDA